MRLSPAFTKYHGDGRTPPTGPPPPGEAPRYLADPQLVLAVNTALAVEQPLLVTGEPGTGKTSLAESIARELGLGPVLRFQVRSAHTATDLLYAFDNLRRFYHAQVKDPRAEDAANYLTFAALGEAIRSPVRRLVLVDEVDKAPRDFPNDLLHELDQMSFTVPETGQTFRAAERPVVLVTSNSERQLPDAFLRRVVFHHIAFPEPAHLRRILQEQLGGLRLSDRLVDAALARFQELRRLPGMEKQPATGELLAWVQVLVRAGVDPAHLQGPLAELPALGALVKTRADHLRVRASSR